MRLLVANGRKLLRRPVTWVTLALLIGLEALLFLAVGATLRQISDQQAAADSALLLTFPGAYELILGFVVGLGSLLAVIYGAAVAGSEWSWGTLKVAIARGEGRVFYTLLGYVAVTLFTLVGLVIAFGAGVVAAIAGASIGGVSLDGLGDARALGTLPELYARGALGIAMDVAIGYAIATVTRSQLAGIGVGIALYFGENFSSLFLPDIVKWFPFQAANAVMAGASGTLTAGAAEAGGQGLDPDVAVVVVVAWLAAALLVASLWTERAEIGG